MADSYVSSASPNTNFGKATTLKVDGQPVLISYLRFDLSGISDPVKRATLRLRSSSSSSSGVRLHDVLADTWGETTIKYSNRPAIGPVVSSSGSFSAGSWASLDATSLVNRDPITSLAVTTTSTSSKIFTSREAALRPELILETEPPPPPPPPGGEDPVIAAAGDIACAPTDSGYNGGAGTATRCRQMAVSDLMVGRNLAAALPLGDLQYEKGELVNFQQVFDPSWGRLGSLLRPVPGNHEYGTSGAAGYFDYFNGVGSFTGLAGRRDQGYYSYDVGAWHLIALNSNCSRVGGCGPGSPQEQWLRSDLATHPASCTLAYWHHPLFTSDSRGGLSEVRPFWQALYEAGADVILVGHHHGYERFARQDPSGAPDPTQGIRQFVIGTGGKEVNGFGDVAPNSGVRNDRSHGVLKLTLRSDGYDWGFVPEAPGGFTDSGSDVCEGTAPDTSPPSAPTSLTGTAPAGRVSLSWKASTDNDGVAEYRILRDGQQIGSSARTGYTDDTVEPGTTYTYEVVAVDPAGNVSAKSQSIAVTTLDGGALAFEPTDDASIRSLEPNTVFGARTYVETDNSPVKHFLLRFVVSALGDAAVESATLRLHSTDPSPVGGVVRAVTDDTWREGTVTWNNAPPGGTTPIGSIGAVAAGNWYEVDVTSLVAGEGPVSLRVTSTSSDGADYSSGESALAPQLIVRPGAPPG